ncbi:MAG: cation diffusion facilitator family transporter [Trueperaceae bacterium]|nr:cation diffusion facilitator family transporter [Trueperaceae bacterium]
MPGNRWRLNTAYVVVEATAGLLTGSLALLANAAHSLTDVAGLLIAWSAAVLATRVGSATHTFGWGRATIFAAMLNAVAILIGAVVVIWEAPHRFQSPGDIPALAVLLAALAGVGANTSSAPQFVRPQKVDQNAKGAVLHTAADATASWAVVVAASRSC